MPPNVFILATCRKAELLPYTECVFKTLRVGFPTAAVTVFLNGDVPESTIELANKNGCDIKTTGGTIHHKWIEQLAKEQSSPFYILDTDVIFYGSMEGFQFNSALAGWRIGEWQDEFSKSITRPRLHTSLLYIDPARVKQALSTWDARFPDTPFTPRINPFYPVVLPYKQHAYFYDTCGILYHAIGGEEFSQEQLGRYFHFQFGTIPDLVLPHLSNAQEIEQRRAAILSSPDLGRNLWAECEQYIADRIPQTNGKSVIVPPSSAELKDSLAFNEQLCCGNRDAMLFNDLWYNYCHGIDDLLDTVEDGRPLMSKEQMLSLFLKAAAVYNSVFFVQYRALLYPIVIDVTNTYSLSVDWERSPKRHRRAMADVWRTCGNRMYSMVALICGGEEHMKKMSAAINERDWLGQHDAEGKPT